MLKQLQQTIAHIRTKTQMIPDAGIILGTGLGGLVNEIETAIRQHDSFIHIPLLQFRL